jgi:hypothetical protein
LIIRSPAGEFPITIDRFEVEGDELVIVGRMGVWDARTHVPPRDFFAVLGKLVFSPSVLGYALRAPFFVLRRRRDKSGPPQDVQR